jgi:hypothetical protein
MRRGTSFWYVAFTDGRTGYLLDLVQRPTAAMARLAIFRRTQPPRVLRQDFPVAALKASADGVVIGPWQLDGSHYQGKLGTLTLAGRFESDGPAVAIVPTWISTLFSRIPALQSQPVTLTEATAGGDSFRGLPGVCSRYRIRDLARARWFLISAQAFDGQDARCEISAGWLFDSWAVSGYLRIGGETIPLNQPLRNLLRFRVGAAGESAGGVRRVQVSYRSAHLAIEVDAAATDDLFARLEREGTTMIHTTLFGDCRLKVTRAGATETLVATGTCLIEVKEQDQTRAPAQAVA